MSTSAPRSPLVRMESRCGSGEGSAGNVAGTALPTQTERHVWNNRRRLGCTTFWTHKQVKGPARRQQDQRVNAVSRVGEECSNEKSDREHEDEPSGPGMSDRAKRP